MIHKTIEVFVLDNSWTRIRYRFTDHGVRRTITITLPVRVTYGTEFQFIPIDVLWVVTSIRGEDDGYFE
jgi:hypothetical protein